MASVLSCYPKTSDMDVDGMTIDMIYFEFLNCSQTLNEN